MSKRKISASYIFTGNSGFIRNGILVLADDGSVIDLVDTKGNLREEPGLEHYNGILCPGFINTHCHLELSHMLGSIPRKSTLPGFIEKIITTRKAGPENIQKSIAAADREMQQEGIVAVGDICNTPDSFEIKSKSKIHYHSFVEIFGTSEQHAYSIFRNGQNLVQQAKIQYNLKANITPHSTYSLSEKLFSLIREEINPDVKILSVHNQEDSSENNLIRSASGEIYDTLVKLGFDMESKKPQHKNSFPWLMEQLPRDLHYLMVHNVYTSEPDIAGYKNGGGEIHWVLCPKSNYFIGGVYPGKLLMDAFPGRVCIGTDSLASNDRLSVLDEIFTLQEVYPEIPLARLLTWATINGATALGIDQWCGSFEKGKKPGIILIENTDIQNLKLKRESRVKVLI